MRSACYAGWEKSWLSGTNWRSSLIVNQAKSTRILIFLRPRTFSHEFLHDMKQETEYNYAIISGGSRGGGENLESPPISNLTLVWDWNSYIDRIVYHLLTGWFFLMKRASHFATNLNSRDIKKCNWFWVPSYNLDPLPSIKNAWIRPCNV